MSPELPVGEVKHAEDFPEASTTMAEPVNGWNLRQENLELMACNQSMEGSSVL